MAVLFQADGVASFPSLGSADYTRGIMVSAARVGALVVLFVAMALGALAVLNQSLFAKRTTGYKVAFRDAGGLTPGSRVMMAGVLVGRVEKVSLASPTQAVAEVALDEPHRLREGSTAIMPSSLLSIGDREIQIIPGEGGNLAEGATIPGSLMSPMESFLPDVDTTMAEVNRTLVSLNRLLNDKELKGALTGVAASGQKTLEAGAETAEKVGRLVSRFDGMAAQSNGKIQAILASSEKSMTSIAAMTGELQKLLTKGDFQNESLALLKKLNEAAEQGKTLVAELNKVVQDPELQASLKTTTANVSQMTESGKVVAKDFEKISAEGVTAGKKVNELLEKANAMADDVKKLLDQFRGTVDKIGGAGRGTLNSVSAEADLISSPEEGRIRTDLNVTFPVGKEKLQFGLYDAFEGNKINLQYLRPLDERLGLRYGVYASKIGVGVDYRIAPSLFARGDLYGLNDPRMDLRLRYDFNKTVYGWAGFDRLFGKNTPVFGVGIRRNP